LHELTKREIEVAKLLGENYTQAEVAEKLGVSARTVKAIAERIRLKLGVRRSREIPRVLKDLGVIE
jgi:DNA-binding CsgD family transcriptional regulator